MTRARVARTVWGILASLLMLTACAGQRSAALPTLPISGSPKAGPVIRIGSFNFPESALLAQLYGQALASAGYRVSLQPNIGTREIVDPALQDGLLDLVPEYAGSALTYMSLGKAASRSDPSITYQRLQEALEPRGLVALTPAPAEDQDAVAVSRGTATDFGLRTISDLAAYAGRMRFGGPAECVERPSCLPGLRRVYGLRFASFQPFDASGDYTVAALADGTIDAALLFSTDGRVIQKGFVVLRDDKGLQPAENVTPVLRAITVQRAGAPLREVLDQLSAALTTEDLRYLNLLVTVRGQPVASVATAWLEEHGLGDRPAGS